MILLLIFQMFLSTIIDYFNETREKTQDFQEGLEAQCKNVKIQQDINSYIENEENNKQQNLKQQSKKIQKQFL